ncbi:hypothetical protein [Cupriavidus sp. H18C1]|uniref:hypothetical protein n=1 Tax=Cupriavidus sp. H18C1 TaxID=3241601 RepID=UPI003BB96C14
MQQPHAEHPFEQHHLLAGRLRRHAELARALAEAAGLGHTYEYRQRSQAVHRAILSVRFEGGNVGMIGAVAARVDRARRPLACSIAAAR